MPVLQISFSDDDLEEANRARKRFGLSTATYVKYFYIACLKAGVEPPDSLIEQAKNETRLKAEGKGKERKLPPLPGIDPLSNRWKGYRPQ